MPAKKGGMKKKSVSKAKYPHAPKATEDKRSTSTKHAIKHFEEEYISGADEDDAQRAAREVNKHFGHHPEADFHRHERLPAETVGPSHIKEQIAHSAAHFDKKINTGNHILYRGANPQETKHMQKGKSYTMRPLLSTTTNKSVADNFHDGNQIHFHGVQGKHTFTGYHASNGHFGNEKEVVLLGNSTKWKVHHIEEQKEYGEKREILHKGKPIKDFHAHAEQNYGTYSKNPHVQHFNNHKGWMHDASYKFPKGSPYSYGKTTKFVKGTTKIIHVHPYDIPASKIATLKNVGKVVKTAAKVAKAVK